MKRAMNQTIQQKKNKKTKLFRIQDDEMVDLINAATKPRVKDKGDEKLFDNFLGNTKLGAKKVQADALVGLENLQKDV